MPQLLTPYDLSGLQLPNRVVMAPLTRSRAKLDVADELTALYYAQRATAGLIIAEGSPISWQGRGYLFIPGIFQPEQVAGWRKVTDSVHAVGGRIFAQLWHVGRVSHESVQKDGVQPVSASSRVAKNAIVFGYDAQGKPGFVPASTPRQLQTHELAAVVDDFVKAAVNAIEAGFDGVEIHAASGYLFDQFLNPLVNDRTDHYSAETLENRMRFTLEVIDAVSASIGAGRVGIRFTPFGELFDMPAYPEAEETFVQLARALAARQIAYIHLMDQSGFKVDTITLPVNPTFQVLLRKLRPAFPNGALIVAGA